MCFLPYSAYTSCKHHTTRQTEVDQAPNFLPFARHLRPLENASAIHHDPATRQCQGQARLKLGRSDPSQLLETTQHNILEWRSSHYLVKDHIVETEAGVTTQHCDQQFPRQKRCRQAQHVVGSTMPSKEGNESVGIHP